MLGILSRPWKSTSQISPFFGIVAGYSGSVLFSKPDMTLIVTAWVITRQSGPSVGNDLKNEVSRSAIIRYDSPCGGSHSHRFVRSFSYSGSLSTFS